MIQPTNALNRQRLVQAFFFLAFGFLLYQLFVLARPFFPGLLGAALLAVAFYPFYVWVHLRVKNSSWSSLIVTLSVILLAVIPIVITAITIVDEAGKLGPTISAGILALKEGNFQSLVSNLPSTFQTPFQRLSDFFRERGVNLEPYVAGQLKAMGNLILAASALTAKRIFLGTLNIIILVITLFFAFRDGHRFFQWVLSLIPMQEEHKKAIAKRAYETFRAVAIGVGVTALVQGFAAMIGYWMAGIKLPVLFGFLTTMFALLGASILITLPMALIAWKTSPAWGIFLLIWGLGVVGTLDNFLRPILIGSRARMPFFLILFSIVGGIKAYGLIGIIFGPVLVASLLTFIKIYREEYGQQ